MKTQTSRLSSRAENIRPFIVMDVLERAAELERQGKHIIHLEVGEPDFNVPEVISAAAQQAFFEGRSHYTHSLGDPELREEIAIKYRQEYGVNISPGQVIVTSGSSPAILLVLGVLCNPGDEIILSDPGYACYPNFIGFIGARAVCVPVFEEDGYQYRPEEICKRISKRTRAILINSPMNPTGNLLSEAVMKQLAGYDIPIISDEIYHGLVYNDRAYSMLEFTENAFVVNGFSKLYAMTGLRLGYIIAPPEYVRAIQKFQQNLFICASSVIQRAAITALRQAGPDIEKMKGIYNSRRIYLINRLRQLGFTIKTEPTGAFYVFVNARHISDNSYKLAFDILEKAHVGVAPGIDFGQNGEGYLRFSYASSLENIDEGMCRLEKYLMGTIS
jgi:(5-formylfuran-3-yl)methyl phosphate transaminase